MACYARFHIGTRVTSNHAHRLDLPVGTAARLSTPLSGGPGPARRRGKL